MTEKEAEFLKHIWNVLGYDTSDGAPPIHEQFYERHKDIIQTAKPYKNKMKSMTDEERKAYFRMKNREKLMRKRKRLE